MASASFETYQNGQLVSSRTVTIPDEGVNALTLQQRVQAALDANATYLAIASPSNAQVAAQVKVLTKECNALIRLLLGKLDDVSGT